MNDSLEPQKEKAIENYLSEMNEFINQYKENEKKDEKGNKYTDMFSEKEIIRAYDQYKLKQKENILDNEKQFSIFKSELISIEKEKIHSTRTSMEKMLRNYIKSLKSNYNAIANKLENQYQSIMQPFTNDDNQYYNMKEDNESKENVDLNYKRKLILKANRFFDIEKVLVEGIIKQINNLSLFLEKINLEQNQDDAINETIKFSVLNEVLFTQSILTEYNLNFGDQNITNSIKLNIYKKNENIKQFDTSNNKNSDIDILKNYIPSVTKIVFNSINDLKPYFVNLTVNSISEVTKVHFLKCLICDVIASISNFKELMPKLSKIVFHKSKVIIDRVFTNLNNSSFPSIKILKIEYAELIDCEFNSLFKYMLSSNEIKDNLTILSFEGNNLTNISLPPQKQNEIIFPNLEELNLRKNKLYCLFIKNKIFPNLQLLNLTNNNLRKLVDLVIQIDKNSNQEQENKKKGPTLILTSKNIYMTEKENIEKQKKNLESLCKNYKRKIKTMSFAGLYNNNNQKQLITLELNPIAFYHLRELDLSFCGLNNAEITNFFSNNKKILQLRKLLLKGNYLDMRFFDDFYINNDDDQNAPFLFMNNLEYLSLSNNLINDENFVYILQFVNTFKNLTYINLKYNPFGLNYSVQEITNTTQAEENIEQKKNQSSKRNDDLRASETMRNKRIFINFIDFYQAVRLLDNRLFIDFTTDSKMISHKTFNPKTEIDIKMKNNASK